MKSLNSYTQSAQSATFYKYGAFFAFSNEQVTAALCSNSERGLSDNKSDYVSMFAGLIAPKVHAKELMKELEEIQIKAIKQYKSDYTNEQIIRYELSNHEAGYTYCIDDTCDAVEALEIGRDEVQAVFNVWIKTNEDN